MRYVFPVDPECPEVEQFHEMLYNDPMTAYSGCGSEIAEDFNRKHLQTCERCQEYGVANCDVDA